MLGLLFALKVYAQIHQPQPTTSNVQIQSSSQTNGTGIEPQIGNQRNGVLESNDEGIGRTGDNDHSIQISNNSSHSIRSTNPISEETIRQYLLSKNSPLAGVASLIASSPYSSTIIAICTIEEYSCSVNPYGSNNFWGLMSQGHIIRYPTIQSGIEAISSFLERADNNGKHTVESFRGWYCASECTNWESTVIKTKLLIESL